MDEVNGMNNNHITKYNNKGIIIRVPRKRSSSPLSARRKLTTLDDRDADSTLPSDTFLKPGHHDNTLNSSGRQSIPVEGSGSGIKS
jgi:hypothetical protein